MRFRAHETFAIRKGWLHKGMKNIVNNPTVFIDKDVNPMEKLGLGTNMVKALRYWLQVAGLTYENQKTRMQFLTKFGKLVWENDKYIELEENKSCCNDLMVEIESYGEYSIISLTTIMQLNLQKSHT